MATRADSGLGSLTWLKVLTGGAVAFILLERALISTQDVNYIPSLLLIGAFTVPISFCLFLFSRARQPDVPVSTLVLCFVWGGILGTLLAGLLEYHTLLTIKALPTLAIGIIEELAKILVPAYFIWRHHYNSQLDGIILGAAAGAGFAVLESMGYAMIALLSSSGSLATVNEVLLFRSLMAPAAHIAWTGVLGGALWNAMRTSSPGRVKRLVFTFVSVVILHALWDSNISTLGFIVLGAVSLWWLMRQIHRFQTRVVYDQKHSVAIS
jgi:RsiW-degrading membrane proteinase PrsW (M82 family)